MNNEVIHSSFCSSSSISNTTNSPYYKGLTDQSLAILEEEQEIIINATFCTSSSSSAAANLCTSPYYKGLTDYSLVIGSWNPYPYPATTSTSSTSSPYYRGLIDYSLALHQPPPSLPPKIKFKPPHYSTLKDLMLHHEESSAEATTVLEDQKPLRERVSEPSNSSNDVDVVVDNNISEAEAEAEKEYVWAKKHQPVRLEDFICNRDKALELKALVKQGCGCSTHFIFEGPPSSGKRSMIRAMLREVFGSDGGVEVVQEYKELKLKGEIMIHNMIKVPIKKSLHHVEVNVSETKGYEKHVILDLFMETYGNIINKALPCSPENCQAIVLYEADKLSVETLLYIKWVLDKYKGCNKVFFCCSDQSKLQPLKPLCTTLRLAPPSAPQIVNILEHIAKQEGITLSTTHLLNKITFTSKNNLRQAIRSFEATCRNKDALQDHDVILTGWEHDIFNIAKNIIAEQSPRQLYVIRRKLQSLMIHDVPPDFIYKSLVSELTTLVDESLRSGVATLDRDYNKGSEIKFETKQMGHATLNINKQSESEERNNESTKKNDFTYLKVEEFIAKFMSWYKNSSEKTKCN